MCVCVYVKGGGCEGRGRNLTLCCSVCVCVPVLLVGQVYLPGNFFVNDYRTLHDHVPLLPKPSLRLLASHAVPPSLPPNTLVLASFSNYQKLDSTVFDLWCNILKRVPHAVLWTLRHHADEVPRPLSPLCAARRRNMAAPCVFILRWQGCGVFGQWCVWSRSPPQFAEPNLIREAAARGIPRSRLVFTPKVRLPLQCPLHPVSCKICLLL